MHNLYYRRINMANYQVRLTPALRNMGTEGSLDTSVSTVNGIPVSIQRTAYVQTNTGGDLADIKVGEYADGATFNDTLQTLTDINGIVAG
jgi:hypothetical protein